MAALSASFVPIMAVMSGQAEQLEAQRASADQIETSLTALLAGDQFAWLQSGAGHRPPGVDANEERSDQQDLDANSVIDQVAEQPEILTPPQSDDPEPELGGIDAEEVLLDGRRRPGVQQELPDAIVQNNPGAISAPPPEAFPTDEFPVPDRWRIMQSLCPKKNGDEAIFKVFTALRGNCHSTLTTNTFPHRC